MAPSSVLPGGSDPVVAELISMIRAFSLRRVKLMCIVRSLCAAAIALSSSVIATSSIHAGDFNVGNLELNAPWILVTSADRTVAAGYMEVQNHGSEPDRLVAAETPAAGRVELHGTKSRPGGGNTMRPLPMGIGLVPMHQLVFQPGGVHLMFKDINAALKQGDKVPVTLTFEKAGKIDVEFEVKASVQRGPAGVPPTKT